MFFRRNPKAFGLTEKIAFFSLDNATLEVGIISNGHGEMAKGICLVFPEQQPAPFGPQGTYVYKFGPKQALAFLNFIDQVLLDDLPVEYQFSNDLSDRWFSDGDCKWVVSKYTSKWHDGGGYRGRIDNSWSYTITKKSMTELRQCIAAFFNLQPNKALQRTEEE